MSEASVYRLLKAHDLITSPAYIVVKAADEFKDKTTAPNHLWQTDFTNLKVTGWGLTNTMPLQVEILYNEYAFTAAFAVASLLALLALVTLALKTALE